MENDAASHAQTTVDSQTNLLPEKGDIQLRHENKYLMDACQEAILRVRLDGILQRDVYAGKTGRYIVRSVYFDDLYDTCARENLAGADFRSKYRIRYYNHKTWRILLEKKTKIHGLGMKESCLLTTEECQQLLDGEIPDFGKDTPEIKKKLLTELRMADLKPKVIVTYERTPLVYTGGNVRVTFDGKITSSPDLDHFLSGDYYQRPVLPNGMSLLEVKWDTLLPLHIQDALRLEELQWTAFSKYMMCRTYHL